METENGSTSKTIKEDLGHINALIKRKNIMKKHKDELEIRYKMKLKGLPVTQEEIKK